MSVGKEMNFWNYASIRVYLESIGLEPLANSTLDKEYYTCPLCGSDKFYVLKRGVFDGGYHCPSCHSGGELTNLHADLHHMTLEEARESLATIKLRDLGQLTFLKENE